MRVRTFLLSAAFAATLAAPAFASTNLVTNGGFEATNFTGSAQFGGGFNGGNNVVTGWTTNGYNMLFRAGTALDQAHGANEQYECCLTFWGPGNGASNGFVDSPSGGNFIAADGAYLVDPISQTVSGLVAGDTYSLTFDWAAAQQHGATYTGFTLADGSPDSDYWTVSLGGESFTTDKRINPSMGFQPWETATFSFKATGTSEVLSFLAHGPTASPPFLLLDNVSLTKGGAVPEPAAWALMILGFGSVGAVLRRRRGLALA